MKKRALLLFLCLLFLAPFVPVSAGTQLAPEPPRGLYEMNVGIVTIYSKPKADPAYKVGSFRKTDNNVIFNLINFMDVSDPFTNNTWWGILGNSGHVPGIEQLYYGKYVQVTHPSGGYAEVRPHTHRYGEIKEEFIRCEQKDRVEHTSTYHEHKFCRCGAQHPSYFREVKRTEEHNWNLQGICMSCSFKPPTLTVKLVTEINENPRVGSQVQWLFEVNDDHKTKYYYTLKANGEIEYQSPPDINSSTFSYSFSKAQDYVLTVKVKQTSPRRVAKTEIPFTVDKNVFYINDIMIKEGVFAYDGTPKTNGFFNLPEGLYIKSYTGNVATLPGRYLMEAEFDYDEENYILPEDVCCYWWIKGPEAPKVLSFRKSFDGLSVSWTKPRLPLPVGFTVTRQEKNIGEPQIVYKGEQDEFVDESAEEGKYYSYRISTYVVGHEVWEDGKTRMDGAWSVPQRLAVMSPSKAPDVVSANDGKSFDISWDAIPNASSYTLIRGSYRDKAIHVSRLYPGLVQKTTDDQFTESECHRYSLLPYVKVDGDEYICLEGPYREAYPLIQPQMPSVKAVSGSSIDLEWAANDKATEYELWRRSVAEPEFRFVYFGPSLSFRDRGLQPETVYFYELRLARRAMYQYFFGPASEATQVKTAEASVMKGDADGNYQIDTLDLQAIVEFLVNKTPCPYPDNAE